MASVFDSYKGTMILEIDGVKHVALWGMLGDKYIETTFTACNDGKAMHNDHMRTILRRVEHTRDVATCLRCAAMLITR